MIYRIVVRDPFWGNFTQPLTESEFDAMMFDLMGRRNVIIDDSDGCTIRYYIDGEVVAVVEGFHVDPDEHQLILDDEFFDQLCCWPDFD